MADTEKRKEPCNHIEITDDGVCLSCGANLALIEDAFILDDSFDDGEIFH